MAWGHVDLYRRRLLEILERILEEERPSMDRAAEEISRALEGGGVVYVLGTGHSMLVAAELFHRAGGLARIYPMLEPSLGPFSGALKSAALERLSGYGEALINYYSPGSGDVLLVVSNSGVNAVPVEAAHAARQRGAVAVAITSKRYSAGLSPRNRLGKRLYEVVDVAIDNKIPGGDASVEIPGLEARMAPLSTIVNAFTAHSLEILAAEKLLRKGVRPEIWASVNVPESTEINRALERKYFKEIKHL